MKLKSLERKIKKCKKCSLYKTANKPVPGEGPYNTKLMFIGLAPGKTENITGKPFSGRSGKFLDKILKNNHINKKKIFITSILKHYLPKNRVPKKEEIYACLPYTIEQINIIKPKTIVLFGNIAKKALINNSALKNKKVIATYHPSAAMRFLKIRKQFLKDIKKLKIQI